jgi:hypothetical protein
MPMRWTSKTGESFKRTLGRFGIKAAIVVSGVAVAAGTIHKATYLPKTPLVARMVAAAPVNVKTPWGTSRAADSSVAPGGLDAGVDHDRISYWVKRLSTSMSGDFGRVLGRKAKYSDMIAAKLEAKQMPRDLVYLAMIESEFNPNAKSPVKAVGLWQFMSATARQFGLTVKGRVDERRDPARATDAAVAYLASLHDRLGSWYLAAAAYNSGEGAVVRALKATTGKTTGTDDDFFRILPLLPKETQDYVPKLIASARVGSDPARYGVTVKGGAANGDVAVSPTVAAVAPTTAPAVAAKPIVDSTSKKTAHKSMTKAKTKAQAKTKPSAKAKSKPKAKAKAAHHKAKS